jgi:hypothetical protein
MSKISRWMLVLLLVVAPLALLLPQPASAGCTKICQSVPHPTNPFCRQCVETGQYQGAHCNQVTACFCNYQDVCFQSASTSSPLDGVLEEEPTFTPAENEPAEEPVQVAVANAEPRE